MEHPTDQIKVQFSESDQKTKKEPQTGTGAVVSEGEAGRIYCLTIIGQIEGHYLLDGSQKSTKYEHVLPQLVAVEQDPSVDGVLILLNTVGGDVEAGLAIAELIAGMTKPTVSLVLGGGHSIGVPLAVAAQTSLIAPSASMTVHPVRSNGLVINAPQTFDYFRQMQQRIIRFVCDHSKIQPQRLNELMMATDEMATDIGTILEGEEAVKEGLIDGVGNLQDALSILRNAIQRKRKNTSSKKNVAKDSEKISKTD